MSVIGSNILAGASGQAGYNLTKSLRFRQSASARLTRTPASASNRRTYTISAWVKLGSNASSDVGTIFCGGDSSTSTSTHLYFYLNCLRFYFGGAGGPEWITSQVFRDYSAWYHIVAAVDTTQATFGNRLKLYINGTEVTNWSAQNTGGNTALNSDTQINNSVGHGIGSNGAAVQYLYDGYMAEFNFIDGLQLTPSSFGQTSTTTGVWIPKKFSGTYGTNGFYLPFTDTTSTSTLGTDFSGNSNTWTVNNISLTAGSTYDSMLDVPTLTSATTANYATLNPLAMYGTNMLISNANLTSSATSTSNDRGWASTIAAPSSGKWYAEFTFTATSGDNNGGCGVMLENGTGTPGESATTVSWRDFGTLRQNASGTSYGTALSVNDVVIVAYDAALGRVWFGKNGTWFASGDPATNANPSATGITSSGRFATYHYNTVAVIQANFGQRPFAYTAPAGFVALNTFNLPTPTIGAAAATTANKYMNIALYTGTGSSQSITGLGFQPDWTWIKGRSGATDHGLYDAVRGVQKQLESNTTDAETTETTGLTAFGSDGFTVGALAQLNTSSATYVGWNWKANGAGSSNTAGSITSTVSANTTAGFSIVTYTGTGSAATIGHGLGIAPSMIIVKERSIAARWDVYHASVGATGRLILNDTTGTETTTAPWNNTAPTSSVFTVGTASETNDSGQTFVAYCFAPIAGYSAFGSYVGTSTNDGAFIYTGFRPAFVLYKKANGVDGWYIFDTKRNPYNLANASLRPDSSAAELVDGPGQISIVSNGFKHENANTIGNSSSFTYIYMAFAENPFKYANAR